MHMKTLHEMTSFGQFKHQVHEVLILILNTLSINMKCQ